jgi:predicted CoA-substrate-specific enzyme activase
MPSSRLWLHAKSSGNRRIRFLLKKLNKKMEYFAGVDIGSTMTKVVIINSDSMWAVVGPTGAEHRRLAYRVMEKALEKSGISFDELGLVVATGYGRINVPFADKQITEISCHARGVWEMFPSARTAIDIGGQDSKAIKIAKGKVARFVMNDKCAAGTGRYLEVTAEALGILLEEMGSFALKTDEIVKISSVCTVFAEQEILSHLAEGKSLESIVAGLYDAVATRILSMANHLRIEPEIIMTGGGAKYEGLIRAVEEKIGCAVSVPSEPLITGAFGAAILARDLASGESSIKPAERELKEVELFS